MRTWACDKHVVDRTRQVAEELRKPAEVSGVERGRAGVKLAADTVQVLNVPACDHELCSCRPGPAGRGEPDSPRPADHEDRLPAQATRGGGHDSSLSLWESFSSCFSGIALVSCSVRDLLGSGRGGRGVLLLESGGDLSGEDRGQGERESGQLDRSERLA